MLFEREELHDFWKDPVRKGGEIIKNHRILWYGEPLPSFIASLAIHTCSRLQMDLSQARNFCMSFNNKGCHSTSCSCNFFHLCLCCGSGRHGFKDCERSQELLEEAQHFQQIFGVDPLHPLSKFGGEDLESILLKLVPNDGWGAQGLPPTKTDNATQQPLVDTYAFVLFIFFGGSVICLWCQKKR